MEIAKKWLERILVLVRCTIFSCKSARSARTDWRYLQGRGSGCVYLKEILLIILLSGVLLAVMILFFKNFSVWLSGGGITPWSHGYARDSVSPLSIFRNPKICHQSPKTIRKKNLKLLIYFSNPSQELTTTEVWCTIKRNKTCRHVLASKKM